jgi:endo-1,4-beta-xylanase
MFITRMAVSFLSVVLAGTGTTLAAEATNPAEGRPPVAAKPGVRQASLRTAGKAAGLLVGAATFPAALQEERYAKALAREFNFITPENEMKWEAIHPEPDKWNFGPADTLVKFAQKHGMKVKGHCLVWHAALPKWVNAQMTPEELRGAVRKHILGEVGHYKGKVYAWDVVNEAVDDKEGLRKSLFFDKLGEGYIAEVFRLAHEADPKALLIYNEYGAEGLGGKSDRVYELVKKLKADGVPIGGVGLQMHISAKGYPKPADIAANVQRLAALGLKVNISEMDVRIREVKGELSERLELQRKVYNDVIAACIQEKGFMGVTFWGFTDAHSWVDHYFGADDPLLFDEGYKPKPAYEGVMDVLSSKSLPIR